MRAVWVATICAGLAAGLAAGIVAALVKVLRLVHDNPRRFESQVREVETRARSIERPVPILLTGSSYVEFWETAEADLAPLRCVNIGIGGTAIGDHHAFIDRLVTPLRPELIVIYAGSNDMTGERLYSKAGKDVAAKVVRYLDAVRQRLPQTRITYVSITETPRRARVRGDIQLANTMISDAISSRTGMDFIDTNSTLLTQDRQIDPSLFCPDMVHLNERGYRLFAQTIRAALSSEFDRKYPAIGDIQ